MLDTALSLAFRDVAVSLGDKRRCQQPVRGTFWRGQPMAAAAV
jgi:hypothetical protein